MYKRKWYRYWSIVSFIDGLERKFEEQVQEQEWGLVLVIPKEVEEKYEEIVTGKPIPMNVPDLESIKSYKKGYEHGSSIDYKKDRKSTRLNSSHVSISYAVFCLKKKKENKYK